MNCSGISVKIASIREVTKLNSKNSASNNFGVQSGHDIFELANLDTQFTNEKARINFYNEFLCARINYFISRKNYAKDQYSNENIVTMIFKSEHNLASFIRYTHAIPRNFLIVLQRALTAIGFDLRHQFLHKYLAEEVVIRTYLEDKRSNLPMNEGSLYDAINIYINHTQHYFFMLSVKQFKRLKSEIDNLVYLEIIHQIPSSILPQNLMDKYKGFYIDCGKYMHFTNSRDCCSILEKLDLSRSPTIWGRHPENAGDLVDLKLSGLQKLRLIRGDGYGCVLHTFLKHSHFVGVAAARKAPCPAVPDLLRILYRARIFQDVAGCCLVGEELGAVFFRCDGQPDGVLRHGDGTVAHEPVNAQTGDMQHILRRKDDLRSFRYRRFLIASLIGVVQMPIHIPIH